MIATIKQSIKRLLPAKEINDTASEAAYDLWAANYDNQPGNLMLALDEEIFSGLLNNFSVSALKVADMGCGTGRHWQKILAQQPAKLTGYDVSGKMLNGLKAKYPQADVVKIEANVLPHVQPKSFNVIISTLTVAHIANIDDVITSWSSILTPDATIIITDFHPGALATGGKRTFTYHAKQVSVCNYVHHVEYLIGKFAGYGFQVVALTERNVDETVKCWYEQKNALTVYEKFKGMPIIYGMCLKRGR